MGISIVEDFDSIRTGLIRLEAERNPVAKVEVIKIEPLPVQQVSDFYQLYAQYFQQEQQAVNQITSLHRQACLLNTQSDWRQYAYLNNWRQYPLGPVW